MLKRLRRILILTLAILLFTSGMIINAAHTDNSALRKIENQTTRGQTDAEKYPITEVEPRVNVKQSNAIKYSEADRITENIKNQLKEKYGIEAKSIVVERYHPPGKTTITYSDGSKIVLPPEKTIELGTYAYRYKIYGKTKNVLYGDVVNAKDMTRITPDGEQSPLEGTIYEFVNPEQMDTTNIPNTNNVTQNKSDILVTFPDGSQKKNYPTRPAIIEIYPYKLAYKLEGQDITVIGLGNKPNPKDGVLISPKKDDFTIDVLENKVSYSFKPPVDTTQSGVNETKVIVTYPDNTEDEVEITVTVISFADYYDPNTTNLVVNIGEMPKAKDSVTNLSDLPEGTVVRFEDIVDTSTSGDKEATIVVNYPDGSIDNKNIIVTVNGVEPQPKDIIVKVGETPNPADGIANKDKLPVGTTYTFENEPDTSVSGDQIVNIIVTYPGGESVTVSTNLKIVEGNIDSDNYEPTGQNITVIGLGSKPSAKDGIANKEDLPEGTTYTFEKPVDTSTSGEKDAVIVVTYPDGSIDKVNIKVDVKSLADKYNPIGKDIFAEFKGRPNPKDGISNKENLPEDILYEFEAPVDTSTTDDKSAVVVVNYSDGSVDKVNITVKIKTIAEGYDLKIPEEKVLVDFPGYLNWYDRTETEKVKKAIKDANPNLPSGTTVEVATTGNATITYSDGSKDTIPGKKLVKQKMSRIYKARAKSPMTVAVGEYADPADSIVNIDRQPEGTIYVWQSGAPDTSKVDYLRQNWFFIIYTDGSKIYTAVDIDVVGNSTKYEPIGKNLIVKVGETVEAKYGIANLDDLPDSATYSFTAPVNTDTVGDIAATIIVTYADNTKDEVDINIKVTGDPLNTFYNPIGKNIEVTRNTIISPKDGIDNIEDLPRNVEYRFKENIDTSTTGKKPATIVIKYSDNSEDKVDIDVIVKSSIEEFILKLPAEKVIVEDKTNLTREEKNNVKDAINEANPDLPIGTKIYIYNEGTADIIFSNHTVKTIRGNKLVREKTKSDIYPINPLDPKVKVADPKNLTSEEKTEVKDKIKAQLPSASGVTDNDIVIGNDGSVTVTYSDNSKNTLTGKDTVVKKDGPVTPSQKDKDKYPINPLDPKVKVADPKNLTSEEKAEVKDKIKAQLPSASGVTDADIVIGNDGSVTVTYPDGSKNTLKPEDTVIGKVDKSELKDAIDEGKDFKDDDDYINGPEDKKKALDDAIDEGEEIFDDPESTQEEVDKAKDKIQEAIEDLKDDGEVDKSELEDAIDEGKDFKDDDDYINGPEDKKKALDDAIDEGEEIFNDPESTQEEVDDAKDKIQKAIEDLKDDGEVDKSELKEAINDGEDTKKTPEYKKANPKDRKELDDAIDDGKEVYDDPDATLLEIAKAKKRIEDAIDIIKGYIPPKPPIKPVKPGYGDEGVPDWLIFGPSDGKTTPTVPDIKPVPDIETSDKFEDIISGGKDVAYIKGYPDGTIRPDAGITRAEVAAMISRLLKLDLSDKTEANYDDTPSAWYNEYINAVTKAGIMEGYPDGTFRPNDTITRGEFTQMISNFDRDNSGKNKFRDVNGHWAEEAIDQELANGRIEGYPDGTFRPDGEITRGEAATILNRTFGRDYSKLTVKEIKKLDIYSDLDSSHWGYYQLLEGTKGIVYE